MASQRRPPGRGLVNLGNTCYLNSVVQSLNALPLFHDYLKALKAQGHNHPLLTKLQTTIEELSVPFAPAFRPPLVGDQSVQKHFKPGEQQDAHEFLTFLLDEISSPGSGGTPVTEAKQAGLSLLFQAPRGAATVLRTNALEEISLTASVAYPRFSTISASSANSDSTSSAPATPFPLMDASLRNSMSSSSFTSSSSSYTPTKTTGFGNSSIHSPLSHGLGNSLSGSTRNGSGISPKRSSPSIDRAPSPTGLNSSRGPTSTSSVSSPTRPLSSSQRGNSAITGSPLSNGTSLMSSRADGAGTNSAFHSPAFLGVSTLLSPLSIAKSKRVPHSPFMGKMESRIRCQNCGYNWSMIQPMTMLSAYIPVKSSSVPLIDCIAGFTRSEDVRGVYCQKCKKTNKVEKRLAVVKEPELLCIFINRLKYEKKPGGTLTPIKLDSHVEFESEFNLGMATSQMTMNHNSFREGDDYLRTLTDSGSALSGNYGWLGNGNGHSSSTTSLNTSISAATSPRRSAASGRNTPSEASSVASSSSQFVETKNAKLTRFTDVIDTDDHRYGYQLIAVIVHLGNQSGGHYICFRATNPDEPELEPWVRISDSDIKEVTWNYVSQQNAYMLFYRKKFPSMDYNSILTEDSSLTQSSAAAAFFQPSSTRATSTPMVHNSARIMASHTMPVGALSKTREEEEESSTTSTTSPGLLTPNGSSDSEEDNGGASPSQGILHKSNGLSFSSSSSLPTSSPEPDSGDDALKAPNPLLQASEMPDNLDHESRSGLRSALGVPSDLLQRPLVEFTHDTPNGFDSILADARPIFKETSPPAPELHSE